MKVAVVTGAKGNLGKAVVKKFLLENYRVFGIDREGEDDLEKPGGSYTELNGDIGDKKTVNQMLEKILSQEKKIDAAVLTAGGYGAGGLAETSAEEIANQFTLNFFTAYTIAQGLHAHMLASGGGNLFFIGSRPGLDVTNGSGSVAYALAKSLLFRLQEIMNAERGNKNVVAWTVVPNIIDTPTNRKAMPKANRSDWKTPEEIAEIIFRHSIQDVASTKERQIIL